MAQQWGGRRTEAPTPPWKRGGPSPWLPHTLPSTEENSYQGSVSHLGLRQLGSCVGGPLGWQPGQGHLQLKKQTRHLIFNSAQQLRRLSEGLWCCRRMCGHGSQQSVPSAHFKAH